METVAKKFDRKSSFITVLAGCILLAVIGAALLIAYAVLDSFPDALSYIGLALIIIGAVLTGLMIFTLVRFCLLPDDLITYENGVLTFPKGISCRAEEVTDVKYYVANPSYKGLSYDFGFGQIRIGIGDKMIKVLYVAAPAKVYKRLEKIVYEAKLSA